MTQHIFDRDKRNSRLQKMHSFGVPERVRTDSGSLETGHGLLGPLEILLQQVPRPVLGEPLAATVEQDRAVLPEVAPLLLQKALQEIRGLGQ